MSQTFHIENTVPALIAFCHHAIGQEQWTHGLEASMAALKLDPNDSEAHHLASHCYGRLGDALMSEIMLERAISLSPENPLYRYNAAVNAGQANNNARAMVHYAQALRLDPNLPDALWNYGECLRMDEQFDLALACFERLVSLGRTDYIGLWNRMSVCYASLERIEEADAMYQKALANNQVGLIAHWEYALFKLSLDDFKTGFKLYDDRFLCDGKNSVYCHDFPFPLWSGQFKQGETLLVHGEQGLGDELMFASIFNELLDAAEKAEAKVVIACKPGLMRLFEHSFPHADVRKHMVGESPAVLDDLKVDAQLPMGHLMGLYRQSFEDFARHRGAYFKAAPESQAHYAQRISMLGREAQDGKRRFRVGLMWGSNPAAFSAKFSRWTQNRSVPLTMFNKFKDLLDDVEFVSLQNHERGAEASLAPHLDILDFSQDQSDFYDTAGLVANLDLVISVCTSVSHLAGGMAAETWVPLMKRADWRHGRERETSIWYDNTRYFRQTEHYNWTDVVDRMHDALRIRVSQWKNQAPSNLNNSL